MDSFVLVGVLLILTVIVGAFMGIFAFAEVKSLRGEVRRLRAMIEGLQGAAGSTPGKRKPVQQAGEGEPARPVDVPRDTEAEAPQRPIDPPAEQIPETTPPVATRYTSPQVQQSRAAPTQRPRSRAANPEVAAARARFWARLQENWMVWLGGACVALAGVFLARYGIEQGLLGPKVRVAMGLVTALALYVASEVLRRKTGGSHPTFAALAGGGAITGFAAVLSAVHLYHLMAPGLAFGLLAVVAMVTMWLARLHGPVLAAIGMLGAYSVPALVSTGGGNVVGAMIYALIISVSVLFLLRYVYRTWLWLGVLVGALAWWLISLAGHQADDWRGIYLAVLAYLLMAVVPGNWLLNVEASRADSANGPASNIAPLILPSLLAVVAAQCLSVLREEFQPAAIWAWTPLALVVLLAARRHASLVLVPWALMAGQLVAWLATRLDQRGENIQLLPLPSEQQGRFLLYLLATAALFAGFALFNYRRGLARYWWASLAVMAPLLSLLVGYVLAGDYLPLHWWCLYAAVFGGVFMYLGSRGALHQWHKGMVVWLFIAAHFAYSLAACLWLEQASLTLALALQVVSLAWIIRRFEVPALGWLLKGVLLLVVVRLTLNPWVLTYSENTHWSLWTYGGSALCAWLGARILTRAKDGSAYQPLAVWAEAAALHLLVLTLWAECRYWLYGGNAFAAEYSFTEAVINMWLFTGLGLVYYRKSLIADSFSRWYDGYGRLLVLAGLANYLKILFATATSDSWAWGAIGERPVFNMLVPSFGGAALLALLVSRFYLPRVRRLAGLVAAVAAFVWVSLEVRQLWQGSIRLDTSAATGELYTYSAVWLTMAVAGILLGSWKGWRSCYQGGMAVLALVIVKLFLVDMSGLEGLLRVASFMGMGLALLGIAYLHQKLGGKSADPGQ